MVVRRRGSVFQVPEPEAEPILQEILVRAAVQKQAVAKTFDPALGATWEEAQVTLKAIREDVGRYGEYVFGFTPARVHQLWIDASNDVIGRKVPQNKILFIAPPGSAKSTWNSIIRPCHYLGNNPDQNILFFTSSDPMAHTFGTTVRATLMENPRHIDVFSDPDCRPHRSRGWSSDGLYLRGTPAGTKDPAYKAVGFGATVMGSRAHGLIIDDALNQQQAQSELEQRRAKAYFDQTLVPRLQPSVGWIIAVMTRFHENDLGAHFIRLAEESGDWLVLHTPQISVDPVTDPLHRPVGGLIWPEHLTPAYVEGERLRMSVAEFNMVHQGDPTGMGGDIFREEKWFQPLPENFWSDIMPQCRLVQGWDLAFSEKDSACFTVGTTIAVDRQLNMYVLHVMRQRLTIVQTEDMIVKLVNMTKPLVVGIEMSSFHRQVTIALAQRILGRTMCNIQLVRPDSDKVARALLPAGRAEAGKVFINKQSAWWHAWVSEMLGFPNTKYKDQVDSFSLATLLVQKLGETVQSHRVVQAETVMA